MRTPSIARRESRWERHARVAVAILFVAACCFYFSVLGIVGIAAAMDPEDKLLMQLVATPTPLMLTDNSY